MSSSQTSLILPVHANSSALYLGDLSDVRNKYLFKLANITHVVSILNEYQLEMEFGNLNYSSNRYEHLKQVKHLKLKAEDDEDTNITEIFDTAIEFIDDALYKTNSDKTNNVLIHCAAGVSRSPTVTIAYLMWKNAMSLDAALQYVKQHRDCVEPNAGFLKKLKMFENYLHK